MKRFLAHRATLVGNETWQTHRTHIRHRRRTLPTQCHLSSGKVRRCCRYRDQLWRERPTIDRGSDRVQALPTKAETTFQRKRRTKKRRSGPEGTRTCASTLGVHYHTNALPLKNSFNRGPPPSKYYTNKSWNNFSNSFSKESKVKIKL